METGIQRDKTMLELLRHALGLKDPTGDGVAFRNHFASSVNGKDFEMLTDLVDAGYMVRTPKKLTDDDELIYFSVTDTGKEWVQLHAGYSTQTT